MDPDCQIGASDKPWEATGTALDRMTIGAASCLVVTTHKTFHTGAEEQTCASCHCQHKVPKRGKTKDDFQMQNSIMLQPCESPFRRLDYFLSLLEPAQRFGEYLQPGNGKRTSYCFKNGKQLFLSQSFIVSSSKTLHKSYKGWRQEQQNNKRNTNDQSRLNTIH